MELPPQLVSAAIQRATADSSSSDAESPSHHPSSPAAPHYASSLLQQFVAQTQLLSHTNTIPTAMGQLGSPSNNHSVGSSIEKAGLGDVLACPIGNQITPNFLSPDSLVIDNQHLSPQQTEELSQINKDLEEITSVSDGLLKIPNPPCLDDCVDNGDFMVLDIASSSAGIESSGVGTAQVDNILNTSCFVNSGPKADINSTNFNESREAECKNAFLDVKRKRGRPRKVKEECSTAEQKIGLNELSDVNNMVVNEFCHNNDPPNVSPDSGILSNHNSPAHSPPRRVDSDESSHKANKNKSPVKSSPVEKRGSRSKSKSRINNNRDRSLSSEASVRRKNMTDHIDRKCPKIENSSPIPKPDGSKTDRKKNENKLDIAALDRMLYATDRVLYPPRRKVGRPPQNKTNAVKKGPGRPPKNKPAPDSGDSDEDVRPNRSVLSEVYAKRKDLNKLAAMPKKSGKSLNRLDNWRDNHSDHETQADEPLDPTWREIDLNRKYRDILSGYKSEHEVKTYKSCSRLIESGYKSDYGFKSGYKTDHCCKSGYKSDHKSGYKSDKSGYKSDHSVRNLRRKMRKLKKSRSVRDRSYYKNQKYFVSDQEILLLANKTFSCLTLGHSTSDSDSESHIQAAHLPSKFSSSRESTLTASKLTLGATSRLNPVIFPPLSNIDLFAPAPVFSNPPSRLPNLFNYNLLSSTNRLGFTKNNKQYFGSPFSSFTHKFACPPISTTRTDGLFKSTSTSTIGRDITNNNNTLKQSCRNVSPKGKKSQKLAQNVYPVFKKEKSPVPIIDLFQKSQSAYVPNKTLSKNIFLNLKKPQKKTSSHWKKQKNPLALSPAKSQIMKSSGRLSRMSSRSSVDSRHHRHKLKKMKKQRRSRSASRSREACNKALATVVDPKFCQEMEGLICHFVKLSHSAPKIISSQSMKNSGDKVVPENIMKCVKRTSKKRKGLENPEVLTPTSKRRHKKQLQESQTKGSKDKDTSANEHKLPLKKRHYHINSSTNNTLSLSLVATEFVEGLKTENSKNADAFLCTETNCPGELKDESVKDKPNAVPKTGAKSASAVDKSKKDTLLATDSAKGTNSPLRLDIDENVDSCNSRQISPSSVGTDDDLNIKKPTGEHSELSKKIYETSEKLKAVNRMVHDLEKCLPKTKESEVVSKDLKQDLIKQAVPKSSAITSTAVTPPSSNSVSTRNAPVVTPKKRHRLEADRLANSSLDLVVQSLSKKLSEDKALLIDKNHSESLKISDISSAKHLDENALQVNDDSKSDEVSPESQKTSSRTASKIIVAPQKSEIITRKKNRLEGLTSNLVSKINPTSHATKVLDTLMSNNLRKSIESRIMERAKSGNSSSDSNEKCSDGQKYYKDNLSSISTRATVIKSPICKLKLPAEAKKLPKGTDILIEETVVVNVDKPTGIFEPSVDIELQIPKSSISLNHMSLENSLKGGKFTKQSDNKTTGKVTKLHLEGEKLIPSLSLSPHIISSESNNKSRKIESIAAVISDKILESGHNLRHSKRNHSSESEVKSTESTVNQVDNKKKKVTSNILKESKLKLTPRLLQTKVQAEKLAEVSKPEPAKVVSEIENVVVKNVENVSTSKLADSSMPLKKRAKRRKTINRTGFPSIKKKRKKLIVSTSVSDETITTDTCTESAAENVKPSSAFDRVPKVGEATNSFLERTTRKKHGELKVLLNKDDCPKQGRVSVIALERLQGKVAIENNNISFVSKSATPNHAEPIIGVAELNTTPKNSPLSNAELDSVAKWEILSETDSIPPLSSSALLNDPEDSIPLSLLNFKSERPNSRLEVKSDRLKRKIREVSPCDSLESVSTSKRIPINKLPKAKSNPVSDKRSTRSNEVPSASSVIDADDLPLVMPKSKGKKPKAPEKLPLEPEPPKTNKVDKNPKDTTEDKVDSTVESVPRIENRRKSRSCNTVKRLRDMTPSSRDSSLETVKTIKRSPKSRDTSVETIKNMQENCLENDPLPIQEKEIDFEKSIDVFSKNIISKKRIMSSRDDSPASSVERGYRSEREKGSNKRNQKMKKKYLVAGLFSDYYKDNE